MMADRSLHNLPGRLPCRRLAIPGQVTSMLVSATTQLSTTQRTQYVQRHEIRRHSTVAAALEAPEREQEEITIVPSKSRYLRTAHCTFAMCSRSDIASD